MTKILAKDDDSDLKDDGNVKRKEMDDDGQEGGLILPSWNISRLKIACLPALVGPVPKVLVEETVGCRSDLAPLDTVC